jgi:hypothetical protein
MFSVVPCAEGNANKSPRQANFSLAPMFALCECQDMETGKRPRGDRRMTKLKMIALAADLIKQGKSNDEIRKILFNTKGARLDQIQKVMALIA